MNLLYPSSNLLLYKIKAKLMHMKNCILWIIQRGKTREKAITWENRPKIAQEF